MVDVERVKIKLSSLLVDGSDSILNKDTSWVATSKLSLMCNSIFVISLIAQKLRRINQAIYAKTTFLIW